MRGNCKPEELAKIFRGMTCFRLNKNNHQGCEDHSIHQWKKTGSGMTNLHIREGYPTVARNSPSWMWRSVPQTPQALTLIKTSFWNSEVSITSREELRVGFNYRSQNWKRNFNDAKMFWLRVSREEPISSSAFGMVLNIPRIELGVGNQPISTAHRQMIEIAG